MKIKVWGVRGSLPSPGPATARYGGNTPCVSVEIGSLLVVLDAGTGIRALGDSLTGWSGEICILLSHLHWDHVQGLPFFGPLYHPGREITLCVPRARGRCGLERIAGIDGVHFPLTQEQIPSRLTVRGDVPTDLFEAHGAHLSRLAVNHPGGSRGFRIEQGGRSFVFIPDNEMTPPYPVTVQPEALADFCRGADVLLHDAQYLPEDLPAKHGWGHSEVSQVCDLAAASTVGRLLLFHHDPSRTDDALDRIQTEARARLKRLGSPVRCDVAAEGMTL